MRLLAHNTLILAGVAMLAGCTGAPDTDGALIGYVEAEYIYAAAPQSGWITEMPAREGDRVAPGDVLFALDDDQQRAMRDEAAGRADEAAARARDLASGARDEEIAALRAHYAEAAANLENAEAELDRAEPLIARGVMPESRGDQLTAARNAARARVAAAEEEIRVAELAGRDEARAAAEAAKAAAEAALKQAEWRLEQRSPRAHVAGQIELVMHRPGEFVSAGAPVIAVAPEGALKVRFFVPQARIRELTPGATVSLTADGDGPTIEATVHYIAQEAEFTPPVIYSADSRDTLVFAVEARLPAGADLRPGLPVDVSLS